MQQDNNYINVTCPNYSTSTTSCSIDTGNRSMCLGQTSLYCYNGMPPNDLIVQHKEHVLFLNPKTGLFQLSYDLRNVYYNLKFGCIVKNVHVSIQVSICVSPIPYYLSLHLFIVNILPMNFN